MPETYTNVFTINVGYPSLKLNIDQGMIVAGFIRGGSGASNQISNAESALLRTLSIHLNVSQPWENTDGDYNDNIGVASPLTISNIDKKIDDGVARTGKFQGYRNWNTTVGNCLTGTSGDYL